MSSAIHVWVCGFRSTIVEPSSRRVFTANRTRPCALNTSCSAQSGVQTRQHGPGRSAVGWETPRLQGRSAGTACRCSARGPSSGRAHSCSRRLQRAAQLNAGARGDEQAGCLVQISSARPAAASRRKRTVLPHPRERVRRRRVHLLPEVAEERGATAVQAVVRQQRLNGRVRPEVRESATGAGRAMD